MVAWSGQATCISRQHEPYDSRITICQAFNLTDYSSAASGSITSLNPSWELAQSGSQQRKQICRVRGPLVLVQGVHEKVARSVQDLTLTHEDFSLSWKCLASFALHFDFW